MRLRRQPPQVAATTLVDTLSNNGARTGSGEAERRSAAGVEAQRLAV